MLIFILAFSTGTGALAATAALAIGHGFWLGLLIYSVCGTFCMLSWLSLMAWRSREHVTAQPDLKARPSR